MFRPAIPWSTGETSPISASFSAQDNRQIECCDNQDHSGKAKADEFVLAVNLAFLRGKAFIHLFLQGLESLVLSGKPLVYPAEALLHRGQHLFDAAGKLVV